MKYWLILLLAAFAGTAAAWVINERNYGRRDAHFGPMGLEGEITAENVVEHVSSQWPETLAHAEVMGGAEHDFGVMAPDEEGSHTFVIRNTGESDLVLRLGASTCKCTFGSLKDNRLPPGEQTDVELQWTVKTGSNRFSQSAEILTNDPENVAIPLKIRGRVVRGIELSPKQWTFGEVAAGEPIELEGKLYNFLDSDIELTEVGFASDSLNELTEFEITAFEPGADDGIYSRAREGFRIEATIAPGLKQGPISDNLEVTFRRTDSGGEAESSGQRAGDGQDDRAVASVTGRVVGALSMVTSSRLQGVSGGGYVYDFGRLDEDDDTEATALVMLKGDDRENIQLSLGETSPTGTVEATLEKGQSRGKMTLYRLHLDLVPGPEPIERLGKNDEDYGWVWIESNNSAKVPPLQLLLKFALPAQ